MEVISQPIDINGVHLANRIVIPPMATNMGILTTAGVAWYRKLASGGAGLVIVESTPLALFFAGSRGPARLTAETLSPLAAAIHAGGARAVLQVFPALESIEARASPASVSEAALAELVAKYGEAARICKAAGFDGIEAHGGHGFFLSQFSCRVTNTRKDRYGASLPTLAQEIVASMKRACPGPGFIVMFRHTIPDPTLPESLEDFATFVTALEQQGLDIFDLSPSGTYDKPGCFARSFRLHFKELGKQSHVAMLGDTGFNEPDKARAAVQEGAVQLVAVGRGQIADLQWARKVLEHRDKEIVKCMRCNIGCHQNLRSGVPIDCVHAKGNASDHVHKVIDVESLPV